MTLKQFEKEYLRLVDHFKFGFEKSAMKEAMARKVAKLDHGWWAQVVDAAILSNNRDFDFNSAIRFERNRQANTLATLREQNRMARQSGAKITDQGLERTLETFGAESVWDAVQKTRGAR